MEEYSHVAIDKGGIGLPALSGAIALNGVQTAHTRGIILATGSQKLEHHLHVFMWDNSTAGVKGRLGIENAGNCVTVKIRWRTLTKPGMIFNGTLQGDSMANSPPSGKSTNGAWAYKGNIPRDACFIEGTDLASTAGFDRWLAGNGWSGNLA
jgi:hypothetical protein